MSAYTASNVCRSRETSSLLVNYITIDWLFGLTINRTHLLAHASVLRSRTETFPLFTYYPKCDVHPPYYVICGYNFSHYFQINLFVR